MGNLNQTFFNEYIKLNDLCKQRYHKLPKNEIKGVTNYIDDMKATPISISNTFSDWNHILHKLIHIRHIRNRLAHDINAFNENLCTQEDIAFVASFHKSIVSQTDPISQAKSRGRKTSKSRTTTQRYYTTQEAKNPKPKNVFAPTAGLFLVVLLILGISISLIYFLNEFVF